MKNIEGNFIGQRIKTVYDTDIKKTVEYITDFRYEIYKVSEHQYLVYQINLANGIKLDLLFFTDSGNKTLTSLSPEGINNLFIHHDEIIHNWSVPINGRNKLENAHIVLKRE